MTTLYALAARLSGMAAVVCAALALLTSPAVSRADEYDCWAMCALNYPPSTHPVEYMTCYDGCSLQGSQCPSNVQNGKYLGCVSAGAACTSGKDAGTCGDSPNKSQCNCNKTP